MPIFTCLLCRSLALLFRKGYAALGKSTSGMDWSAFCTNSTPGLKRRRLFAMSQHFTFLHTIAGSIPVRRFVPEKPGPLLVLLPSIYGISPDVIAFSERFAQEGALVYAVDPFWRDSLGPLRIPEDTSMALQRKKESDPEQVYADLLAICEAGLQDEKSTGDLILLGICFGGKFALRAAQERSVSGLAVWHGSGLLPVLSSSALGDALVSMDFGAADPMIPTEEVEAIRRALEAHASSIRLHDNAGHGFSHVGTSKCEDAAAEAAQEGVLHMICTVRARSSTR